MTLGIMTLTIMIRTLNIITLSIMTLGIITLSHDTQDKRQSMLNCNMLSVFVMIALY
jgi:hypothetical protein